ncbi:MAG: GGDEF domain-containing protein [Candidatus Gastranaerophilales bacterium]|nr:GGDEF domain-containing protein [Candidatus Gastranaerophilales bacterium]
MKNVIIYTKNSGSELENIISKNEDYSARVKDVSEIKDYALLNPSLIILDLPASDAQNVLMTTKFALPVLIKADEVLDITFVRADAYDYVLTPINEKELMVRVQNLIKVKELKESINLVSTTDELTGLFNRKYLHQRLEAELSRSKRYNISISCLLLDIDNFKVINDMYGYDCGDILLKKLSEIMTEHVRKEDVLTRYGDEEFIILLPNTDEEHAYLFAERLRRDIAKLEFIPEGEEEPHPVSVSGGVSSYPFLANVDEDANTLIRYAEHALYNAKRRGKNKIVQFSQVNIEM